MKIVTQQRALKIIRETPVEIRQEFTKSYDMLSAINFGEFVIDTKPTLYYSVQETDDYYYIFFGIYHFRDYSHFHDFEGILLRKAKTSQKLKEDNNCTILITRSHYNLFFYNINGTIPPTILIEGNGHGIEHSKNKTVKNYINYTYFKYQNMNDKRHQKQWKEFFGAAKHIQAPWFWLDTKMDNYIKKHRSKVLKKYKVSTSTGLIWNDPDTLINIAMDMGYVK